ncbi:MAG: hypothetical protein ICV66_13250 [Chitinophagaceae bacterium]|nr:hypothetical protein [Chitinophagaceae bacterium]
MKVFGNHNLLNLHPASLLCRQLNISATQFCNAIHSFKGAAKRLEQVAVNNEKIVFRDFAHAPSKVKATVAAVKQQFPDKKLNAVLELHTYSSLNENFMQEYRGSLQEADEAVVFYSRHALELKRLPDLRKEKIREGFGQERLQVFNNTAELENWLNDQEGQNSVFLFMSSGNYEGLNVEAWAKKSAETAT